MPDRRSTIALLVAAALGLAAASANAQEAKEPVPDEEKVEVPFFLREIGFDVQASLHCVATRNALGTLGSRMLASTYTPAPKWKFEFDEVIPLNWRNLKVIEDHRSLPDLRAKELTEMPRPDRGFYAAYIEALWRSHYATQEMLDRSAEDYKRVVYADLASDAKRYRGKIITVQGTLTRLRERDAPRRVESEDIFKFYIGEVRGPTKGAPAFVAVFTELPWAFKDLKFGTKETEEMSRSVTFQGYFLANIRFPADKGTAKRDVSHPYLVGKTIIVHDKEDAGAVKPQEEEGSTTSLLVVGALGGIVVVVLIGVLVNLWLRRGDRKIHAQLAEMRDKHQPFSLEPDDAPTAAAEPAKPGEEAEK